MKRIINIILVAICICTSLQIDIFAHKGRTDQHGGHRDIENASGLGYYHYHCGGYPPHLHNDGICPYTNPTKSDSYKVSSMDSDTTKSFPPKFQINTIAILIFTIIVINIIISY